MIYFFSKVLISSLLIALSSELAKRSTTVAALLISLPTISILSFIWVFIETKDTAKISELSTSTLLLVLPSLVFFVLLPFGFKLGLGFWPRLSMSILGTALTYAVYVNVLLRMGLKI